MMTIPTLQDCGENEVAFLRPKAHSTLGPELGLKVTRGNHVIKYCDITTLNFNSQML